MENYNFYTKYLKYKFKYQKLMNQIGNGGPGQGPGKTEIKNLLDWYYYKKNGPPYAVSEESSRNIVVFNEEPGDRLDLQLLPTHLHLKFENKHSAKEAFNEIKKKEI